MPKFVHRAIHGVDEATFWERLFFDPEFNHRLYYDVLGFDRWEVIEDRIDEEGGRVRRVRIAPGVGLPAPARKVVGNAFTYVENGRLDPQTRRFDYRIEPALNPARADLHGAFWVEPRGERTVERFHEIDAQVTFLGFGRMIENRIGRELNAAFDRAAEFAEVYLREEGIT